MSTDSSSPNTPNPQNEASARFSEDETDFWDLNAEEPPENNSAETTDAAKPITPAPTNAEHLGGEIENPTRIPTKKTTPSQTKHLESITKLKPIPEKTFSPKPITEARLTEASKTPQTPNPITKPSKIDDSPKLEKTSFKPPEKVELQANPSKILLAEEQSRTPDAKPKPNRKKEVSSVSIGEKISIALLAAFLLIAGFFAVQHFNDSVPTKPLISKGPELPIQGTLVKISALSTYWRKPITTGENRDVIRRGTLLIPAAEVTLSSDQAAIRAFFRDENGDVIGDPITKQIKAEQQIEIAATAGFEDKGMHAAYQTGDSTPWTLEIFELPAGSNNPDELKILLKTEIKTDLR